MSRLWWLAPAVALLAGCSSAGAATIPVASFTLTSPAMTQGGELPQEYTCDGSATTPPLAWSGAPAGTVAYAVVMHHVPGPGDTHWYWVLYGMDASIDHFDAGTVPASVVLGTNSVNGRNEYAPPCSKGPGVKVYTFTVYALSAQPALGDPSTVTRAVLLSALDGLVLASATLDVTYDRTGATP
jgi:phosphatidylethanolamine-binding protein (PEBP) family uncharacterized protein